MHTQYITFGNQKLAIINIRECHDLIEYVEDLEDSIEALRRTAKANGQTIVLEKVKEKFLANKIKEVRLSKRLTQKDLATKLETSQAFISKLESPSYRPSLTLLEKVSKTLGCDVEDLI